MKEVDDGHTWLAWLLQQTMMELQLLEALEQTKPPALWLSWLQQKGVRPLPQEMVCEPPVTGLLITGLAGLGGA